MKGYPAFPQAAGSGSVSECPGVVPALANSASLDYLRLRQTWAVDRLLTATAGDGISLTALGMELN